MCPLRRSGFPLLWPPSASAVSSSPSGAPMCGTGKEARKRSTVRSIASPGTLNGTATPARSITGHATYASGLFHYHRWFDVARAVERGESPEPPENAMDDLRPGVTEVGQYGGAEVALRPRRLFTGLYASIHHPPGKPDPAWESKRRYQQFLAAALAELGVPARDDEPRPKGLIR